MFAVEKRGLRGLGASDICSKREELDERHPLIRGDEEGVALIQFFARVLGHLRGWRSSYSSRGGGADPIPGVAPKSLI